jgi:hypothetical protein
MGQLVDPLFQKHQEIKTALPVVKAVDIRQALRFELGQFSYPGCPHELRIPTTNNKILGASLAEGVPDSRPGQSDLSLVAT